VGETARRPSRVATAGAVIVVVASLFLTGSKGSADSGDDDRPPIIIANGSLYFNNGDPSSPITPTQWTSDVLLNEWKPADNNYKGISGFAVTFENSYAESVCAAESTKPPAKPAAQLVGDEVRIEYTLGGSDGKKIVTHVRRRRSHVLGGIGKYEPKVVEPQGGSLKAETPTRLVFEDPTGGYISKVTVGQTDCVFPAPPATPPTARTDFRVRVQPKKES